MSSVPYSRYLIYPIPWYSFLIVTGASLALFLACRAERASGLPKDTFIDLALRLLPVSIIGARIYYVVFSWHQFSSDPVSVFRIWEGGLAIYGGVIAGLVVLVLFCRRRRLPPLLLCDLIAPGLSLAQSIGRWGNWFNIEAYGLSVTDPSLCFFPLSLQVPDDGYTWHLATFFYESSWDFAVFLFLFLAKRRFLRKRGDVFFFYVHLYAVGRLVIEELRMDSLYITSSVRVSQLLSVILCLIVLFRYARPILRARTLPVFPGLMLVLSLLASIPVLIYTLSGNCFPGWSSGMAVLFLSSYALLMIISLFSIYSIFSGTEVSHADNQA